MAEILYSRIEDGAFPVEVSGGVILLKLPGEEKRFGSKRGALKEITQTPDARNWTWDRYFRLGRWKKAEETEVSVFDLFKADAPKIVPKKVPAPKGVDLAKRGHEVRKLLFAGFGGKIRSAGYDPDDVLQEVYKGILIRNNGACPFDPSKASFGHYVHMVCNCVVSNFHRKMSRQRKVEPIADEADELFMEHAEGVVTAESEDFVAADLARVLKQEDGLLVDTLPRSLEERIFPLVREGYGRSEISEMLGISKNVVTKALSSLRAEARSWSR